MRIDSDIGIFGFNNELASRNIRIVFMPILEDIRTYPAQSNHQNQQSRYNPLCRHRVPHFSLTRVRRFFMYNFYAAVLLRPFVAHGGTIIRRAVVSEDYLRVLICLFNNAFNALVEILLDFINRTMILISSDRFILFSSLSFQRRAVYFCIQLRTRGNNQKHQFQAHAAASAKYILLYFKTHFAAFCIPRSVCRPPISIWFMAVSAVVV